MEAYLKALCMNQSVISSIRRASMLPSPPSQGNILIQLRRHSLPGGGGGYSWEFLAEVCRPVLQILTWFRTKECNILSTPVFRLDLSNPYPFSDLAFMLSLLKLGQKHTPVVPSKTIPNSRTKWAKCISIFSPKQRKNPTRWGRTYLCGLYKGVPPHPVRYSVCLLSNLTQ